MKQLWRLQVRRLFSNWLFLIMLAAFIGLTTAQHVVMLQRITVQPLDKLSFLVPMLSLSYFFFVLFLFLSFEFFYRLQSNKLDEALSHATPGLQAFYISGILVLMMPLVLSVVLQAVISLAASIRLQTGWALQVRLLAHAFFDLFWIGLIGILVGACLSRLKNRFIAWAGILILALLGSPYALNAIGLLVRRWPAGGPILFWIYDLFNLFPVSLDHSRLFGFGFSLLPYRIGLGIFWAFLAVCLLILLTTERRRLVSLRTGALLLTAVVSLLGFWWFVRPSNRIIQDQTPRSNNVLDQYYYRLEPEAAVPAASGEEPDFTVTAYRMDVRVTHELTATAEMTVDQTELAEYSFTLYHGYRVLAVTDGDGRKLDYIRDADQLSIRRKSSSVRQLIIRYAGSSPSFSSNPQLICLPAYFPWYPFPGRQAVWDRPNNGYNRFLFAKAVPFDVSVSYNRPVYSNLKQEADGRYRGLSEGVTIVAGFYHEQSLDAIQVIYPYLEYAGDETAQLLQYMAKARDKKALPEETRQLIVLSAINIPSPYNRVCELSDHLIVRSVPDLFDAYELQKIEPMKLGIFVEMKSMMQNPMAYWLRMNQLRLKSKKNDPAAVADWQHALENRPFARMAVEIERHPPEFIAEHVITYVYDQNDRRSPIEFLKSLEFLPLVPGYVFKEPQEWRIEVEYMLKMFREEPSHYWEMRKGLIRMAENGDEYAQEQLAREDDERLEFTYRVDELGADFVVAALEGYLKQDELLQSPAEFLRGLKK